MFMPRVHSDMPDEELMLAYARGDAAAFDALYARHEGALAVDFFRPDFERVADRRAEPFQR